MQGVFLPFLGTVCRSLGWFPVWLLMFSVTQQSETNILLCCAMFFGCGLLCGIWQRTRKLVLRYRIKVFSACLLMLPPAAAGFGIYWLTQRLVPAAVMPLIMMLFCIKGADRDPSKLYDRTLYVFTLTGAVLTTLMLKITSLNPHTVLMFSLTAVISAGFLLLRNQCMLERLVSRRGDGEGIVPREIRRHNLMLVAGIFVVMTLILLLRDPAAELLTGIGRGLITLFVMGARWITSIVSGASGGAPDSAEETETVQQEMVTEYASNSPLWELLWIPALVLVFYFVRLIVRSYAYDIREWFRALRERLHRGTPEREIRAETGEYTDTESDALPEDVAGSRAQHRKWAKQLKAWEKSPDSPEKFYAGYQLLLTAPAWDTRPENADTVLEVQEKWRKSQHGELDAVTGEFQTDRYAMNGLVPSAVQDMHTALQAVSKL